MISLDQQDEDRLSMSERMRSNTAGPDENTLKREDLCRLQSSFCAALSEREQYILVNHYGLDGRDVRTMADIGKSIGLSRERVRQIEVGALMRLRALMK